MPCTFYVVEQLRSLELKLTRYLRQEKCAQKWNNSKLLQRAYIKYKIGLKCHSFKRIQ